MTRLLNAELFKLRRNIALYVLIGFMLVSTCILAAVSYFMRDQMNQAIKVQQQVATGEITLDAAELEIDASEPIPDDPTASYFGRNAAYSSSMSFTNIVLYAAILVVGVLVNEFSRSTIRLPIALGYRREQIFAAKLLTASLGMSLVILSSAVFNVGVFSAIFGWGGDVVAADVLAIVRYTLLCIVGGLGVTALAFTIGILTRSAVGTIGIAVGVSVVLSLAQILFTVVESLQPLAKYMPDATFALIANANPETGDVVRMICVHVVLITVCAVIGLWRFRRMEIK